MPLPNYISDIVAGLGFNPGPKLTPKKKPAAKPKMSAAEKKKRIDATAKRVAREGAASGAGGFGTAAKAALLDDFTFGLGNRLGAAGTYLMQDGDVPYSDILDLAQAITREQRAQSGGGNIIGSLAGGLLGGSLVGRGVGKLATKAARAGVPGARAVKAATTLERGREARVAGKTVRLLPTAGAKARNMGKLTAAGGAFAGAQAVGQGKENPVEEAAIGAVATPITLGAFRGTEWLTRPIRDGLRLTGVGEFLKRYTTTTSEELAAKAAEKRKSGIEPTIFELLPARDQEALRGLFPRLPTDSRQRIADKARERIEAMGTELQETTRRATSGQERVLSQRMASDLAGSRGAGLPTGEDIALAQDAIRNPLAMDTLRRTEATNIMAPYDTRKAYASIDELLPARPAQGSKPGEVVMEDADPDVTKYILRVAGDLRNGNRPIEVRDITDMMSTLSGIAGKGGIEGRIAEDAQQHLANKLADDFPDMAEDIARMRESFAGRRRMEEGYAEGQQGRPQRDIPASGRSTVPQAVRNAYLTPEGEAGRFMGQRAALDRQFGQEPGAAMTAAKAVATGPNVQEALEQNLGPNAARAIQRASAEQLDSLRGMQGLSRPPAGEEGSVPTPDTMATIVAGLNPASMTYTKLRSVAALTHLFRGIPEGRANQIVDALLSTDPATRNGALALMNNLGSQGRRALREIAMTAASASAATSDPGVTPEAAISEPQSAMMDEPGEPDYDSMSPEELMAEYERQSSGEPDYDSMSPEELMAEYERQKAEPFGRSVIQTLFPEAEITDDLRDPNSKLGRENPDSYHNKTDGAVDVRPIPGMTFEEFVETIRGEGFEVVEAIDETKNPSRHATGPHWHVVIQ